MAAPTETHITRVINALLWEQPLESIIAMLSDERVTGYDAFLAVKAAEVCIAQRQREIAEEAPTVRQL